MTSSVDPLHLPPTGQFAIVEGREYRAVGVMRQPMVTLYMDKVDWQEFRSPAEVSRSAPDAPRICVTVHEDAVTRLFTRVWLATWYGEEVVVDPIDTETARISYDRDPSLAKMMGMKGDQYSGFTAEVPYSELSDFRVVEHDTPIPGPWGHRD